MVASTSIPVVLQRLSRAAATLPAGALDAYVELVLQSIPRNACDMLEELLTCSFPSSSFQPAASLSAEDDSVAGTQDPAWGDKVAFQSTCVSAGLWLVQQPGVTPWQRVAYVSRVCAPVLQEEALACEWVTPVLRSQASGAVVRAFAATNEWAQAAAVLVPACTQALDKIPGVASDLAVVAAMAGAPDHLISVSWKDGSQHFGGIDPANVPPLRLTLAAACDVGSLLVEAAATAAVGASLAPSAAQPSTSPIGASTVDSASSESKNSGHGQAHAVTKPDAADRATSGTHVVGTAWSRTAAHGGYVSEFGGRTEGDGKSLPLGQGHAGVSPADLVLICHMGFLPRALAVLSRGSQRGGRDRFAAVLRSLLPSVLLLRRDVMLPDDRQRHAIRSLWSCIGEMLASDDSRRSDGYALMLRFASLLLPPVPLDDPASGGGSGQQGQPGGGRKVFTVLEEAAFWDAVRSGMLGKDALTYKQSTFLLRKALESLHILIPPEAAAAASEAKGKPARGERKRRGKKKGEPQDGEAIPGAEGDGAANNDQGPGGDAPRMPVPSSPQQQQQQGPQASRDAATDQSAGGAMREALRMRWESYFGALDLLDEFSMPLILAGLRSLVDRLHALAVEGEGEEESASRDPASDPATADDTESLRVHARPSAPLLLALDRATHQHARLWLDFSWLQALWVRGLRHDNPKVRYVALQALFGRRWAGRWLQDLPEEFLSGPLLTVLCEPGSHKAFGSAGFGRETSTSAAQFYDKYTRSLPAPSRQSFALVFLSSLLAASQSRVHPCSRPGLLCLLGCARRVVAAAVADGSGAFGTLQITSAHAGTDASITVAWAARDEAISHLCALAVAVKHQYNPRYRFKASEVILETVTFLAPSAASLSVRQIGRIFASLPDDVVEPGTPLRQQVLVWVNAQNATAQEPTTCAGGRMFDALDHQLKFLLASSQGTSHPEDPAAAATACSCEEWAIVLPLVALSPEEQLSLLSTVTEVARTAYRRPYMSADVTGRALRLLQEVCRGIRGFLPAEGATQPAYAPGPHEMSLERVLFNLLAQSMEEVVACASSAMGALWMQPAASEASTSASLSSSSPSPSAEKWAVCVLQAIHDCGQWITLFEDRRLHSRDSPTVPSGQPGVSLTLSVKDPPRIVRRGSPLDASWRKSLSGLFVASLERLGRESSWLVSHPRRYAGVVKSLSLLCSAVRSSGMAAGLLIDTQGCVGAVREGISSLLEPQRAGAAPPSSSLAAPLMARMDKSTREQAVLVATWKWRALDAILLLQSAATDDVAATAAANAVALSHASGQQGATGASAVECRSSLGGSAGLPHADSSIPLLLTPDLRLQLLQHAAACLDVAGDDYAVPVLRVLRHVAKELAEEKEQGPATPVAREGDGDRQVAGASAAHSNNDSPSSPAWAFLEANLLDLAKSAVAAVVESRDRSYVLLSVMLTAFLQPALFVRRELHVLPMGAGEGAGASGERSPGPLMWLVRKLLSLAERSARTGRISSLHLCNLWLRYPAVASLYVDEICHMALYGEHGVDQEFELDEDSLRAAVGGEYAALQMSLLPEMTELFRNSELFVRVSVVVLLYKMALRLEAAEATEAPKAAGWGPTAAGARKATSVAAGAAEASGAVPLPSSSASPEDAGCRGHRGVGAGASSEDGESGDVTVIRELGQTILLRLLRASVYDPELSRDAYRKLSETHRRKIRMWQLLCVLTRFLRPNVEEEVLDLLMRDLDHTNMPSVRQYFEIFAMHYFLRFPSKIFSNIIVPLGRSDLRPQSLSSLIMIAASILLHCPADQRDVLSRRLLPAIVPWACSHHHNLRNFSQALLHQIFKQQIVETRKGSDGCQRVLPEDGAASAACAEGYVGIEGMACDTLHAINDFLATNKDVKRMREAVELFFEEYHPLLKSTPQGIFCDFALAQMEAIDSPGFECVPWTLTERINNFIKETRNHIRAEVAAEQELFDREQRQTRQMLASATQKRKEAAAAAASSQGDGDGEAEGEGSWELEDDGDGGEGGDGGRKNGRRRGGVGLRGPVSQTGEGLGSSNFQRKVKVNAAVAGGGDEDVDGVAPAVPAFMQEVTDADMLEEELMLAAAASEGQRLSSKRGLGAQNRWQDIIVVATFISHIPNLGGLARTCEVFRAASLVISDLRVMEDPAFQGLSKTAFPPECAGLMLAL
eukprot:jgi/Mesvir1/18032/Mv09353-RA.3